MRPTPNNRDSFVKLKFQSEQAELLFRSAHKGGELLNYLSPWGDKRGVFLTPQLLTP